MAFETNHLIIQSEGKSYGFLRSDTLNGTKNGMGYTLLILKVPLARARKTHTTERILAGTLECTISGRCDFEIKYSSGHYLRYGGGDIILCMNQQ